MQQARVIVTDYLEEPLNAEREILGDLAEVRALQATSEDHLLERTKDADALLVYHFVNLTARVIEQLEHCRIIVRCGVGYDNVDVDAARRCAVPVANVPDYGTEEVADSALGMILSLTRGIHRMQVRARAGDTPWSPELARPLYRLRGRTLGIVGLGRIGSALALRAKAVGFKVSFHDPYLPDGMDKALGILRVESLEELLEQSQVLSIHCPGTQETNELIGKRELDLLPEGAYLVNTARGSIVNENAVVDL
ncbi:MAG: C-terminal binding protein, partial [Opitutales bacterium]